jgi:hypothetical protein
MAAAQQFKGKRAALSLGNCVKQKSGYRFREMVTARRLFQTGILSFAATHPIISVVFNKSKGGDPMSSDFVFQNVASADCTFGKQSSR